MRRIYTFFGMATFGVAAFCFNRVDAKKDAEMGLLEAMRSAFRAKAGLARHDSL